MGEGQIRVLGPVHLHHRGQRLSVGNETTQRLLASLVAAEGGFVSAHELAERLWSGEAPGSRLRMAVSRLRARLAEVGIDDAVVTMPAGYRLETADEVVDAVVFGQLLEDARAVAVAAPDRALALLDDALGLWCGPAFEGLGSESWLAGTVERLRELRLGAEDLLVDLHLRGGRAATVLDRLSAAVDAEPLREQRWVQLVTALAATSRRSEALRAIDRARRVLGTTVGLGLGAELTALEQALLSGTAAPGAAAPWRSALELVGRDAELTHLRRLLRSTRVVVVIGLGGVGKSALAGAFAAEVEASGTTVLRTAVDAVASPAELRSQFAATLGLQGTDDPEGLFDAIARHSPREGLWVVDGAEADPTAVADAVTVLARALPALRFVITSRMPVGVPGASPLPLEPLAIGTVDAPGPAMRVLSNQAGVLLDSAPRADLEAVLRLCHRAGGLPLALELLAAASTRSGLHALAAHDAGGVPGIEDSVAWALGAMTPRCRVLLEHIAHLAGSVGPQLAATLADTTEAELVALLGPAIQSRLLHSAPAATGHRYQMPDAVRSAIRSAGRAPEEDRAIHRDLCALGHAVGALHGPADPDALRRLDAELDNVRHWLARGAGTAEGMELALSTARGWKELGLGGEGASWIAHQLAAGRHPPEVVGAAQIAAGAIRGFLDLAPDDVSWLEGAVAAVDAADDVLSWLHGTAQLTLVYGWAGEINLGYETLIGPAAQARLAEVEEPWFRTQRQSILALGPTGAGLYHEARGYLRAVVDQYLEHGDPSAALDSMLLRAVMARVAEDWDAVERDLAEAAPLLELGIARGTVAAMRCEHAYVIRARQDPNAPRLLLEAIAELERAGSPRLAAGHLRSVGQWLVEDGQPEAAIAHLQVAIPPLLRHETRGAALTLARLSTLVDPRAGALLAGAARRLHETTVGLQLSGAMLEALEQTIAAAEEADPVTVDAGARLSDRDILDLVAGLGPAR